MKKLLSYCLSVLMMLGCLLFTGCSSTPKANRLVISSQEGYRPVVITFEDPDLVEESLLEGTMYINPAYFEENIEDLVKWYLENDDVYMGMVEMDNNLAKISFNMNWDWDLATYYQRAKQAEGATAIYNPSPSEEEELMSRMDPDLTMTDEAILEYIPISEAFFNDCKELEKKLDPYREYFLEHRKIVEDGGELDADEWDCMDLSLRLMQGKVDFWLSESSTESVGIRFSGERDSVRSWSYAEPVGNYMLYYYELYNYRDFMDEGFAFLDDQGHPIDYDHYNPYFRYQ